MNSTRTHPPHRTLPARITALAFAVIMPMSALAQDTLWTQVSADLVVAPPAYALRVTPVRVNLDAVRAVEPGDVLALDLHGVDVAAEAVEVTSGAAARTIIGRIHDEAMDGSFSISIAGDAVAGWFHVPSFEHNVRLAWGGPSVHYVCAIDDSKAGDCAGSPRRDAGRAAARPNPAPPAGGEGDGGLTLGGCSPPPWTYFDVMVVYTAGARTAAGGANAIQAEAANAVGEMSLIYLNCNMPIRARLVHLAEVNYNESGSGRGYEEHLDFLTTPDDGEMDGVHSTRDTVDADFVSLIVDDDSSGGLGWCYSDSSEAFSVCHWENAAATLTMAHEIGHNLGCAHNPENADCEPTENGYGHHFFVDDEGLRRHSVMSYSVNGSTRIPYHSNPSVFYMNEPTGTTNRDNVSVILSRDSTCAGFRLTRMDVWVDFNWAGTQNGSFIFPFDTLTEGVNRCLPNSQDLPEQPTLHIKAGSGGGAITISKPMTIQACGGTVTLG
jgi:hypothetical protein